MSFLEPTLLIGLPLIALPIVIHLLNRRRYRSVPWGAMIFLLSATRRARRRSRLRQLLILLARTLAVGCLIFVVSRPLASGVLAIFGAGPDTVIIILDRSASMSQQDLRSGRTKLATAVARVSETLRQLGGAPQLVLIDSATQQAHLVDSIEELANSPETGPSDGAADIPSLLQTALEYLVQNRPGRADVWVCSDSQREDWNVHSGKWSALRAGFEKLTTHVRFQVLNYGERSPDNLAVRIEKIHRDTTNEHHYLILDVTVRRSHRDQTVNVPLAIVIDGARSVVDLRLDGDRASLRGYRIELDADRELGWGYVELPSDANSRDNVFYFSYGPEIGRRTIVVSDQPSAARSLALAAAPPIEASNVSSQVVPTTELAAIPWNEAGLILWQADLPPTSEAAQIKRFVDAGGAVVFLPAGPSGLGSGNEEKATRGTASDAATISLGPIVTEQRHQATSMFASGWGDWQKAPADQPFAVQRWRDDRGLLANTASGTLLPVGEIKVRAYRSIFGGGQVLARLSNGQPLLTHVPTDRGAVFFLATLPQELYSNLARQGIVLVVIFDRALELGTDRLAHNQSSLVGDPLRVPSRTPWQRVSPWRSGAISTQSRFVAGVYRVDTKLIARNRPVSEDLGRPLGHDELEAQWLGLDFHIVNDRLNGSTPLVSEIWRWFAVAVLLALLVEAALCLPNTRPVEQTSLSSL